MFAVAIDHDAVWQAEAVTAADGKEKVVEGGGEKEVGGEEIGCSSRQSELRAPALPLLQLWLSLEQLLERTRRAELGSPASCSLGLDRRSPPSLNIKRTPSAISVPGRPSEKTHT